MPKFRHHGPGAEHSDPTQALLPTLASNPRNAYGSNSSITGVAGDEPPPDAKSVRYNVVLPRSNNDGKKLKGVPAEKITFVCGSLSWFAFVHSKRITIAMQSFLILLALQPFYVMEMSDLDGGLQTADPVLLVVLTVCCVVQSFLLFNNLPVVMKLARANTLSLGSVTTQYIIYIVGFASIYMLLVLYKSDEDIFLYADHVSLGRNFGEMYVALLYLSISTCTGAVVGDILINSAIFLCGFLLLLQVLIGVVYHIAVFAFAVQHFQDSRVPEGAAVTPESAAAAVAPSSSDNSGSEVHSRDPSRIVTWLLRVSETRSFVPVLLALQAMLLVGLTVIDIYSTNDGLDFHDESAFVQWVIVLSWWVFLVIAALIVVASYRLVYRVTQMAVTFRFLILCYFATIFAFSNLYFFMYVSNPENFRSYHVGHVFNYRMAYWQAFYFALTTFTASNMGDLYPTAAMSRVFVSVQMLCVVFYEAVVLSEGIALLLNKFKTRAKLQRAAAPKES